MGVILTDTEIGVDPFALLRFDGQTALVAGAGAGIGRAAARLLHERGASVVGLDLAFTEEAHSVLVKEICADVSDHGSLLAAHEQLGVAPTILVNCVGITGLSGIPAGEVPTEDFMHVLQVNLVAAFALTQLVLPSMLAAGYGRIVHVASIAGKEGNPGMASYSASKSGLIGLVKSVAKDYAGTGVTVNALAPAVIRTALVDAMPEAQVSLNASKIPMGRLGTLTEAAELIAWIASPAASFNTGVIFDLSGGRATY